VKRMNEVLSRWGRLFIKIGDAYTPHYVKRVPGYFYFCKKWENCTRNERRL